MIFPPCYSVLRLYVRGIRGKEAAIGAISTCHRPLLLSLRISSLVHWLIITLPFPTAITVRGHNHQCGFSVKMPPFGGAEWLDPFPPPGDHGLQQHDVTHLFPLTCDIHL